MNLTGKPFNVGELKTPITIQNPTINKDAGGAQSATWMDVAAVRCKWVNDHGTESTQSGADTFSQRATVMMRYLASVTSASSVLKNGERWQVVSLDDIQERHEYIELRVERVKGTV
jgi:SPP1 family predicted phage head-tail adaptor